MGTSQPSRRDRFRQSAGAIATKLRDGQDAKSTASRLNDNAAASVIERTVQVSETHIANMILDEAKLQGIWCISFIILLILNVPTTAFWVALKPFGLAIWNIPCIAGALPGDYSPPLRCTTVERTVENVGKVTAMRMALTAQESNGDATARNVDTDAQGLGQVMPGNVEAWSKEILGRELTLQEFRNNPDLQIRIIEGKLAQYFKQAETAFPIKGAGGDDDNQQRLALDNQVRYVASTWYSGRGNLMNSTVRQCAASAKGGSCNGPNPGNFYPSIYDYTVKVLERFHNHYSPSGHTTVTLKDLPVTSPSGWRTIGGKREFHQGVDFGCKNDEQVLVSPFAGTFTQGDNDPKGYGSKWGWITSSDGAYKFQVGHNIDILVEDGGAVSEGQAVFVCGNKGRSSGPHYDVIATDYLGNILDTPQSLYD